MVYIIHWYNIISHVYSVAALHINAHLWTATHHRHMLIDLRVRVNIWLSDKQADLNWPTPCLYLNGVVNVANGPQRHPFHSKTLKRNTKRALFSLSMCDLCSSASPGSWRRFMLCCHADTPTESLFYRKHDHPPSPAPPIRAEATFSSVLRRWRSWMTPAE